MRGSTRAIAAHRFLPRVWVGNPRTPGAAVGRTLPNFGFSSFHVSMCNLSFSRCPRRKPRFDALYERCCVRLHTLSSCGRCTFLPPSTRLPHSCTNQSLSLKVTCSPSGAVGPASPLTTLHISEGAVENNGRRATMLVNTTAHVPRSCCHEYGMILHTLCAL